MVARLEADKASLVIYGRLERREGDQSLDLCVKDWRGGHVSVNPIRRRDLEQGTIKTMNAIQRPREKWDLIYLGKVEAS